MNIAKIKQPWLEVFPGDFSGNNLQRQTLKVLWASVDPVEYQNTALIALNEDLAHNIGLGKLENHENDFFFAQNLPENIKTYATAYAGHQFGNWAGQLGDGRVIFAGEIENADGKKTEIQWKGAGATPYSRFADGRAVLRSSIREFLMSEAMHHLGIPTTRALSLGLTGEEVIRDIMYNGNSKPEKGAVIIRTAESFLRFGHFELISAQKETKTLQKLADFTVENYFPMIKSEGTQKYKDLFTEICNRTADLMVEWFRVGFVHGVMNTDNMSALGLTIDYGPFSFLDEYDLNFTPNTTDLPGRRYAFGKQGQIAQWNLWQLANALFPLIKDEKFLQETLDDFSTDFWQKHDEMLCRKFGFDSLMETDQNFFSEWQTLMQDLKPDYTIFFKKLENYDFGGDSYSHFKECFYQLPAEQHKKALENFLTDYAERVKLNHFSKQDSKTMMKQTNPCFILRNYLLFECIEEVNNGNMAMFNELWEALKNPYEEKFPKFSVKRPAKYDGEVGCSMLSCSS